MAACGAAATAAELLVADPTLTHPRRDLAIPCAEIEGRTKLL
jgi:hypothetical protein